jgi:hypothetical protein
MLLAGSDRWYHIVVRHQARAPSSHPGYEPRAETHCADSGSGDGRHAFEGRSPLRLLTRRAAHDDQQASPTVNTRPCEGSAENRGAVA